jgi:hypothetical protein
MMCEQNVNAKQTMHAMVYSRSVLPSKQTHTMTRATMRLMQNLPPTSVAASNSVFLAKPQSDELLLLLLLCFVVLLCS